MLATKKLPDRKDLVDYNHAVAGHQGTMCDADGELFIKPCKQAEIDFYQLVNTDERHRRFAEWMPTFVGTLSLTDKGDVPDLVNQIGPGAREQVAEALKEAAAVAQAEQNIKWVPNGNKPITTDRSIVLANAAYGFKHPNILDAKLGKRLFADSAPLEKKQKFEELSRNTTSGSHGVRITGMRVYKGSENTADLDAEGYKTYDNDFGKKVEGKDLANEIRKFIFNKHAGVDKNTGMKIANAFLRDLKQIEEMLSQTESKMYSASLLFTYEGDAAALRTAMQQNPRFRSTHGEQVNGLTLDEVMEKIGETAPGRSASRVDSGIALDDDGELITLSGEEECREALNFPKFAQIISSVVEDEGLGEELDDTMEELLKNGEIILEDDDEDEEPMRPPVYSVKLIDFAHARFCPGEGPDENSLMGVRSMIKIFEELTK